MLKTAKGIDEGEAEAAAQYQALGSNFVLSDDRKFIEAIRKSGKHFRILTSLHLLAWLDVANLLLVPDPYFHRLYKRIRYTNPHLRAAYFDVKKFLGLSISKKDFNNKASLARFGIK
jgi:hypothetical protein